jgi:hypothetical protein
MEETKITVLVACKSPLTESDLDWLEQDITSRLRTSLVQKLASVEFTVVRISPDDGAHLDGQRFVVDPQPMVPIDVVPRVLTVI